VNVRVSFRVREGVRVGVGGEIRVREGVRVREWVGVGVGGEIRVREGVRVRVRVKVRVRVWIRVRELNVMIPKRVWDCSKEWVYKGLRITSTKEVVPESGNGGFKFSLA